MQVCLEFFGLQLCEIIYLFFLTLLSTWVLSHPIAFVLCFPQFCLGAEAAKSRSDMAEELSRQLEDILSTYCRESLSDDNSTLDSGQSHSPELNGLTKGDEKPEDEKVNGGKSSTEKQQRKTQEKKKVKGLGKK